MIVFKNKKDYLSAKAWHDHGHENNPKVPRWEDTRTGSDLITGLTSYSQLLNCSIKKIKKIIKLHRKNSKIIWNKIKNLKGVFLRKAPRNSYQTFDSLVIKFDTKEKALNCRSELVKKGLRLKFYQRQQRGILLVIGNI